MRRVAAGIVAGLALLICAAPAAFGQSREDNGAVRASRVQPPTTQIIVKWRDGTASTAAAAGVRAQKLGASAGVRLVRKQQIAVETDVLQLDRALGANECPHSARAHGGGSERRVRRRRRAPLAACAAGRPAVRGSVVLPERADRCDSRRASMGRNRRQQRYRRRRARHRRALRASRPAAASRRPASCSTASISFPRRRSRTTATAATPTPAIRATWVTAAETQTAPFTTCERQQTAPGTARACPA